MCEDWEPFLSLDEADGEGPGEVCDLGTVLARHSLVAWIDGFQGHVFPDPRACTVTVALEVSHDAVHWYELGNTNVGMVVGFWPHSFIGAEAYAWPARYVRAKIKKWPREITGGLVSATIASA
jgi:hypothetical protein